MHLSCRTSGDVSIHLSSRTFCDLNIQLDQSSRTHVSSSVGFVCQWFEPAPMGQAFELHILGMSGVLQNRSHLVSNLLVTQQSSNLITDYAGAKFTNSLQGVSLLGDKIIKPANRSTGQNHSSGAVWESRWTSWAVRPKEPSGFRGRKELLNRASALVTTCP